MAGDDEMRCPCVCYWTVLQVSEIALVVSLRSAIVQVDSSPALGVLVIDSVVMDRWGHFGPWA